MSVAIPLLLASQSIPVQHLIDSLDRGLSHLCRDPCQ